MLASIIYNYGKFCDDFKSTLKLGAYAPRAAHPRGNKVYDGETAAEALENVETVISEWIETAKAIGREIPVPKGKLMYA